jgi:hemerythrin-like domain-containing protein
METRLDRLLDALLHLSTGRIPEVEATLREIQNLAAVHFEKEEKIFYPALRTTLPDLLAQMDRHHEEVREVERYVEELLANQSSDPRWLDELRRFGIELHDLIQHHIVDEEDQLFRLAADRLSGEEQERLAALMREVPESFPHR